MTRAVVLGESHTNALANAISSDPERWDGISVYRLESKNRPGEPNTVTVAKACSILESISDQTPVFFSMLGTYHNVLGLLRAGCDYDFMVSADDRPKEASGKVRIPHRAIASAFEQHLAKAGSIAALRAATRSQVFLLSSPPPKQNNSFLIQKFMKKSNKSYHGRSIEEVGVDSPESRLKLWKVETKILELWAERHGISFVHAPVKAINDDGFLSRKFYFDDATHANARYGELVLAQISEKLSGTVKELVSNG